MITNVIHMTMKNITSEFALNLKISNNQTTHDDLFFEECKNHIQIFFTSILDVRLIVLFLDREFI